MRELEFKIFETARQITEKLLNDPAPVRNVIGKLFEDKGAIEELTTHRKGETLVLEGTGCSN